MGRHSFALNVGTDVRMRKSAVLDFLFVMGGSKLEITLVGVLISA